MLPTCPIVALQSIETNLISPDGNLNKAFFPSLAINWAETPADLTNWAPFPGFNSILCITVPTGISFNAIAFPGFMSAVGPDNTVVPTSNPTGANI